MSTPINRLQLFSTRAFRNAQSIAIVGNAGIDPEDNELIERADCVVRFNNYATRAKIEYTADRFRCDLLVSTFDLHSQRANPKDVLIGIPYPFKARDIMRKIEKWYPKSVPYMLNPYWNLQLCETLDLDSEGFKHPLPSVGMTLVYHLEQLRRMIPTFRPTVHVCGFRWYADAERETIQDRKTHLPKAKHFNHHYREEMMWFLKHCFHNESYSFSPTAHHILKTFEPLLKNQY